MIRSLYSFGMLLLLGTLSGCVTLPPIKVPGLDSVSGSFVIDQTKPDNYPAVGLAEGNIYSCRAGIRYIKGERFTPSKAATFGALLVKELPGITARRVVLERFEIYQNYRLRSLSGTRPMGGAVFAAVAGAADNKNNKSIDLPNFSLKANPGNGRWKPAENQVGCDGRAEGEYYASEVSGGHDVIVTWLNFTVDEKPYSFRSAFQYQFDESSSRTADDMVMKAIELTVAAVAAEISP